MISTRIKLRTKYYLMRISIINKAKFIHINQAKIQKTT